MNLRTQPTLDDNWLSKMGGEWKPGNRRRYDLEERRAKAMASAWGFAQHICIMSQERRFSIPIFWPIRPEYVGMTFDERNN